MSDQEQGGQEGGSPLEQLREELLEYLSSVGQQVVGKVTDKLKDIANPSKLLEGAGGGIAGTAARAMKGENPVKAFVTDKAKGAKDKVVGKAKEAVGMGGGSSKAGDLKAINIIEHIDVGVPLRQVYNQWTQLEDFGSFTNGVSSVTMDDQDETKSNWKVRVWPSTRSWNATVTEQVPDQRIIWSSEGSKGSTHGCVSFHRLEERLTRVVVVCEYYPSGFFEKVGNIWRAQGRRLRLDLKHFQRYVTLQADSAEVEGWRGEIREGEVVRSHEEVVQAEEEEQQGAEGEEEGEYDGEYEGEEGEGEEGEDEGGEGEEDEDEGEEGRR